MAMQLIPSICIVVSASNAAYLVKRVTIGSSDFLIIMQCWKFSIGCKESQAQHGCCATCHGQITNGYYPAIQPLAPELDIHQGKGILFCSQHMTLLNKFIIYISNFMCVNL